MACSKKGSSLTVPTDHESDRLNRLVASVPEPMRRRRRKPNRVFGAKRVVDVHGNRQAAEDRLGTSRFGLLCRRRLVLADPQDQLLERGALRISHLYSI